MNWKQLFAYFGPIILLILFSFTFQSADGSAHYVSFYGDGFVQFPVSAATTTKTIIELHFRTTMRSALLLLVVGVSDYCVVTLQNGLVVVRSDLGAGETTLTSPPEVDLSDREWHYVNVTWSRGLVLLTVDRVYVVSTSSSDQFSELNVDGNVFVGGTPPGYSVFLYAGDVPPFRGCMHHAVLNDVDILELAGDVISTDVPNQSSGVVWGQCSPQFWASTDEPISFVGETAFVKFDATTLRPAALISFDIRTRSTDALVVYSPGVYLDSTFVLLELIRSRLKLRLGSERPTVVTSQVAVDDGGWHHVELQFSAGSVAVVVDGRRADETVELGDREILEQSSSLYVGGVSELAKSAVLARQLEFLADSRSVVTSMSGCIRNFVVDAMPFGFEEAVASRDLEVGCVWAYPCQSDPCPADSRCVEDSFDRYHCRCTTDNCYGSRPVPGVSVQGPLRVRDLVVSEGGQGLMTTDNVDILTDYRKAGLEDSQVVFVVRRPPRHGELFVVSGRRQTNFVTFTMADLRAEHVTYWHDGSEQPEDDVAFDLRFDGETGTGNEFRRTYNFTLTISIIAVNDRPTMILPENDSLVIVANSPLRISPTLIGSTDPDDQSSDIEISVDYGGNETDGGYFDMPESGAGRIVKFSQVDVMLGRVRFVHRGSSVQTLRLTATDGKNTSETRQLTVNAVAVELRPVANTGLVVLSSSTSSLIRSENLTFVTNAVYQDVDVRYEVTSPPRDGEVQRLMTSSEWKMVTSFTQKQVDAGRLRYSYRAAQAVVRDDMFRFRVSAASARSPEQEFSIHVIECRVELVRSTGLRLRGVGQGPITVNELRAVSTVPFHSPDSIVFRIISTPRHGFLLIDDRQQSADGLTVKRRLDNDGNFTQDDLDSGRVFYRLHRALFRPIQDDFEFQLLSPGGAQSDVAMFDVRYDPPPPGGVRVINNGLFDVLEGNGKPITSDDLYVEKEGAGDYRFTVSDGPRHGELRLVDGDAGILISRNVTSFTTDNIRSRQLYYTHDDTETIADSFDFQATPVYPPVEEDNEDAEDDDAEISGSFDVTILSRNDNAPQRVVDRILNVVSGRGRVLTIDDLRYDDPDRNFDASTLEYFWQTILNGLIVMTSNRSTVVRRFPQRSLTDGSLYFRHSGALYTKSNFYVTDGRYETVGVLEVQASEPYVHVPNDTSIEVERGGQVVLTSAIFVVDTNLDVDDPEVRFVIIEAPRFGSLRKRGDEVRRFTLSDVKLGDVIYLSAGDSLVDSFRFIVRVDDVQSTGEIRVDVLPPPEVVPSLTVVSIRGAVVDELQSVTLTQDLLDVEHPLVDPGGIRYVVTSPTRNGLILSQGGATVRSFSQADVSNGRLRYEHRVSGSAADSFQFNVRAGEASLTGLLFTFEIVSSIIPLESAVLTVIEGQSAIIDGGILRLGSRYVNRTNVNFVVIRKPSAGRLGLVDSDEFRQISQFSVAQLRAGSLAYIHGGGEDSADTFTVLAKLGTQVTDKRSQPTTVNVTVIGVNDQPPVIVVNARMKVWTDSATPVTNEHLLAEDNDTRPEDIAYTMLSRPTNGDVMLLITAGSFTESNIISNFTQALINKHLVVFRHRGSPRGSFQFEVTDGLTLTNPQSFHIEATQLVLHLEALNPLDAFPGIVQPITTRHLQAVTNDVNQSRPITFTLLSKPRLGRVVSTSGGSRPAEVMSFTQSDIDAGHVGYEHVTSATETAWTQEDSFVFDVTTTYAAPLQSRLFSVRISFENINTDNIKSLVTLESVTVDEGGDAVLNSSILDVSPLQERLETVLPSVVVHCVVVEIPTHGVLTVDGIRARHGTDFIQEQIDAGSVVYRHDDSDTLSDFFTFGVRTEPMMDAASTSSFEDLDAEHHRVYALNITVRPVDDQPFKLETLSPSIGVIQSFSANITREVLTTTDPDTSPDQLVYEVINPPTNGRLLHVDRPTTDDVTTFSQKDVDSGKIYFEQDGSPDSGAFYFRVSDGVHKSLYKIFNIVVIPLTLTLDSDEVGWLEILQGDVTTTIDPKIFPIETNGDRSKVFYNVTTPPVYGELHDANCNVVMRFTQTQVDNGEIHFHQSSFLSAYDEFYVIIHDMLTVIIPPLVEVTIKSRITSPAEPIRMSGSDAFVITLKELDASELLTLSGHDPVYYVDREPKFGRLTIASKERRRRREVFHRLETSRRRSKRAEDELADLDKQFGQSAKHRFTHDDIVNNRVTYTPDPVASEDSDGSPQKDGFHFVLVAPGIQPADGELSFEVTPPAGDGKGSAIVDSNVQAGTIDLVDDEEPVVVEDDSGIGSEYVTTALIVGGGTLTSICSIVSYRCYRLSRRRRWKRQQRELEAQLKDLPEPVERHAADLHPTDPLLTESTWTEPVKVLASEDELRELRSRSWLTRSQQQQQQQQQDNRSPEDALGGLLGFNQNETPGSPGTVQDGTNNADKSPPPFDNSFLPSRLLDPLGTTDPRSNDRPPPPTSTDPSGVNPYGDPNPRSRTPGNALQPPGQGQGAALSRLTDILAAGSQRSSDVTPNSGPLPGDPASILSWLNDPRSADPMEQDSADPGRADHASPSDEDATGCNAAGGPSRNTGEPNRNTGASDPQSTTSPRGLLGRFIDTKPSPAVNPDSAASPNQSTAEDNRSRDQLQPRQLLNGQRSNAVENGTPSRTQDQLPTNRQYNGPVSDPGSRDPAGFSPDGRSSSRSPPVVNGSQPGGSRDMRYSPLRQPQQQQQSDDNTVWNGPPSSSTSPGGRNTNASLPPTGRSNQTRGRGSDNNHPAAGPAAARGSAERTTPNGSSSQPRPTSPPGRPPANTPTRHPASPPVDDVRTRTSPKLSPEPDDVGYATGSRRRNNELNSSPSDNDNNGETAAADNANNYKEKVAYDWDTVDPQLLDLCRKTTPVLHKNQYWV